MIPSSRNWFFSILLTSKWSMAQGTGGHAESCLIWTMVRWAFEGRRLREGLDELFWCLILALEDGRCCQKEKERLLVSEFLLLKVSEGQRRERQKQSQKERGIQQGHRGCAVFRTVTRLVLKGLDIGFWGPYVDHSLLNCGPHMELSNWMWGFDNQKKKKNDNSKMLPNIQPPNANPNLLLLPWSLHPGNTGQYFALSMPTKALAGVGEFCVNLLNCSVFIQHQLSCSSGGLLALLRKCRLLRFCYSFFGGVIFGKDCLWELEL